MPRQIGLQLYTVRQAVKNDYVGTLRRVAEMGYHGVEAFGSPPTGQVKDLRAVLNDHGLKLFSAHVSLDAMAGDFEAACAAYAALGAGYVGLAWLPEQLRTPAGYQRAAQAIDKAVLTCAKHGLTFFYHNHGFEFDRVDGGYALDALLAQVDPSVQVELDVGWATQAGVEPSAYLRKLAGRARLVHIKDYDPAIKDFTIIGDGVVDFPAIMQTGDELGVDWYVVEQDRTPRGELESARASLQNIKARGWLG